MPLYTDEEKAILNNYFIDEDARSNKDFKIYKDEKLAPYQYQDEYGVNRIKRGINENETIWSNETNDNLITHFFKQPKFTFSNTKIKNMLLLRANINHQNNDGDTPLHIMVKREKPNVRIWAYLLKFLTNPDLDLSIKNNEGKTAIELLTTKDKVLTRGINVENIPAYIEGSLKTDKYFSPYSRPVELFKVIINNLPQTIDYEFYERWKSIHEILSEITDFYLNQPSEVINGFLGSQYYNTKLKEIDEINAIISNIGLSDKLNKELPVKSMIKTKKI